MFPSMSSLMPPLALPAFLDVADALPQPVLAIGVPVIFALAYLLVVLEEVTHMRKSKPVILAAGMIWTLIAIFPPTNVPTHGEAAEASKPVPLPTKRLRVTASPSSSRSKQNVPVPSDRYNASANLLKS